MAKYRIKTEAEFIEQFGLNWREKGHPFIWDWHKSKDVLFGMEVPFTKVQSLQLEVKEEQLDGWSIEMSMITSDPLPYRWRVKTEAEFIEIYGTNWMNIVHLASSIPMHEYYGYVLTDLEALDLKTTKKDSIQIGKFRYNFSIAMFTCDPLPVKTSKTKAMKYRIKTEEEFIRDYGANWKSIKPGTCWGAGDAMDHLLGVVLPEESSPDCTIEQLGKRYRFPRKGGANMTWLIDEYMITENIYVGRSLEPSSWSKPQYRVKTKAEFEDEFGSDWRESKYHGGIIHFPPPKDELLGCHLSVLEPVTKSKNGYDVKGFSGSSWGLTESMIVPINTSATINNSYINSNQTTKQHGKATNNSIKVQGSPVAIKRGERPVGTGLNCRRKRATIAIGHLSHQKVSC